MPLMQHVTLLSLAACRLEPWHNGLVCLQSAAIGRFEGMTMSARIEPAAAGHLHTP